MTLGPEIAFVLVMTITTSTPPLQKGDAPILHTATYASENFETLAECDRKVAILKTRLNTAIGNQKINSFSLTCADKRGSKETIGVPPEAKAKIEKDIKEMKGDK